MRLNHYLSQAGVASRRAADELIAGGRVAVNGQIVTTLGIKIDPAEDEVKVNHQTVKMRVALIYYLVNKPPGVVSTTKAQDNSRTVLDLVPKTVTVFPVGRLDKNSRGLIILTNDGDLTYKMTHPKYGLKKTYWVTLDHSPNEKQLTQLRQGVKLKEGVTAPAEVEIITAVNGQTVVEISIHQGWNRQVRRIFEVLHLTVRDLTRIKIGPLELGDVKEGGFRVLSLGEVEELKKVVGT